MAVPGKQTENLLQHGKKHLLFEGGMWREMEALEREREKKTITHRRPVGKPTSAQEATKQKKSTFPNGIAGSEKTK